MRKAEAGAEAEAEAEAGLETEVSLLGESLSQQEPPGSNAEWSCNCCWRNRRALSKLDLIFQINQKSML